MNPITCQRPALGVGALALGTILVCARAEAQGTDEFGPVHTEKPTGSPQSMALEVRFGPYRPRVDSQISGSPYEAVFGDTTRYMIGVEFDYQALRIPHLGSFGPGIGLGYTNVGAKALIASGNNAGMPSGQDTSLAILPVYAVGVLRVDVLARETVIPLAFYAKAGLGYALWWTSSGDQLSRVNGTVGAGSSYGYHAALGGMFLLNVLDQEAAVDMDNGVGINSSYVFFEYYRSDLSGFGSGRMQVGANTWVLGLTFEF